MTEIIMYLAIMYVSMMTGFFMGRCSVTKTRQVAKQPKAKVIAKKPVALDDDPYAEALKKPSKGISTI